MQTLETPAGPVLFEPRNFVTMPRNNPSPVIIEGQLRGMTGHFPGGNLPAAYDTATTFEELFAADRAKWKQTIAEHCSRDVDGDGILDNSDVGYNYGVGRSGVVLEGRGWTRNGANGSFTKAQSAAFSPPGLKTSNPYYVSVQIFVGMEPQFVDPTPAQWEAVKRLYTYIVQRAGIAAPTVNGHRDVRATGCPGDVIYGRLPEIAAVWPIAPPEPETPTPPTPEEDDMLRYIQPEGDAAVFLLDGLECSWLTGPTVEAISAASPPLVAPGVTPVKRQALKGLVLVGPAPDAAAYAGATQPGRTKPSDFAGHRPNG